MEGEGQTDGTVTLWVDGCYDGFHYGHANAIRQALSIIQGRQARIIAGVHSDAEITKYKGIPLYEEDERYAIVKGCRWVSEVVLDTSYIPSFSAMVERNADFLVHGDDAVADPSGNDIYAVLKRLGRYLECGRTQGISTTSLIQRVLRPEVPEVDNEYLLRLLETFSTFHIDNLLGKIPVVRIELGEIRDAFARGSLADLQFTKEQYFVGYIGSSWDCFGSAHVESLDHARKTLEARRGVDDSREVLLVVGVWSDEDVVASIGEQPLLAMLERALAVAQCRYTDCIVLCPPPNLDARVLSQLGVDLFFTLPKPHPQSKSPDGTSSVEVPPGKQRTYNRTTLRERVEGNWAAFEARQNRKLKS